MIVVCKLVSRGASVNAADVNGWTALHTAAENGHADVVRELVVCGANIDAADVNGRSSLLIASQNGHADVVRELLSRGASVHFVRELDSRGLSFEVHNDALLVTLRSASASSNNEQLLHALLDRDALAVVNAARMTELIAASLHGGQLRWTKLLLECGASTLCDDLREYELLVSSLFERAVYVLDLLLSAAVLKDDGVSASAAAPAALPESSRGADDERHVESNGEEAVLRTACSDVMTRLLAFYRTYAQPRNIFVAIARSRHVLQELETTRLRLIELSKRIRVLRSTQLDQEQDGVKGSGVDITDTADGDDEWRELVGVRDTQLAFALQETRDLSRVLPDRPAECEALTVLQYELERERGDAGDASDDTVGSIRTASAEPTPTEWRETLRAAYDKVSRFCDPGLKRDVPLWFVPPYALEWDSTHAIGEGAFTTVHLGKLRARAGPDADDGGNDTPVVVKCLRMHGLGGARSNRTFFRDVDLWYKLSHLTVVSDSSPTNVEHQSRHHLHILQLLGACHVSREALLVVERAEHGNLLAYLQQPGNAAKIWDRFHDAAVALQYLHTLGVVHGHLTCANIVVTSDERAKLTDFGFHDVRSEVHAARANTPPVSPRQPSALQWTAPECLRADGQALSLASDVYSLGMCMLEAITQGPPWGSAGKMDDCELLDRIEAGELPRLTPSAENPIVWELVKMMLAKDPKKRIELDDVVKMLDGVCEQIRQYGTLAADDIDVS